MISESEIREKLAAVDAGELPLWDFYDWIEIASINMHLDSSQEARRLVGRIKIIFAEYDAGGINQAGLLRQLVMLVQPVVRMVRSVGISKVEVDLIQWGTPKLGSWVASSLEGHPERMLVSV